MTTVLITNAYSSRNRGDAAIVLGMIESLRRTEELADAEIVVSSADPVGDAEAYGVRVVPSFQSLAFGIASSSTVARCWFAFFALPVSLLWAGIWRFFGIDFPVGRSLRNVFRTYAEADLVVAAGGGYLYTNSVVRGSLVLLGQLYSFVFGRVLGKPVFLYAQSIGPFGGRLQAWLVGRALRQTEMVQVRESISRDLVDEMNLKVPIRLVADAAFLLRSRNPDQETPPLNHEPNPLTVGMTVRQWFRDGKRQQGYEQVMASFVAWLVECRRMSVVFMPQVTVSGLGDDDRRVSLRIAASAGPSDNIRVIEDEYPAAELQWLCGRMEFFVGTRMHSNIFALSSGVPTLAIAYQPKTQGIMSEMGLGDCVLPIERLTLEELQRVFDVMVDRKSEIRTHLESTIPSIEVKALEAGQLIAETFAQWKERQSDPGERP